MKLEKRSYAGKLFRPTPEIFVDPNGELIIVATPWGTRTSAERAVDEISSFYLSAKDDQDVTSPFDLLTSLSPMENNLRTSILFANQAIYQEDNTNEYVSGSELFVAGKDGDFFFWSQVGNPSLLLKRVGRPLIALSGATDLGLDYSKEVLLPPIPSELVGLEPTINVRYYNLKLHPGDRIFLLSNSSLEQPSLLLEEPSIDELSRTLSRVDGNQPHWVGEISF
ncbi:MAG: hypothetical protein CL677_01175 [Bdellovibrionaceae bacterium]|nr:hypothetical protein [Pseudobdellovibrionaceae bacterium]|tara:strand:- start:151375 stop:152046 length:672 start_codon:yes stop_codon:yes gene_type:complete